MGTPESKRRVISEAQICMWPEPENQKEDKFNNQNIFDKLHGPNIKGIEHINISIVPPKNTFSGEDV